MTLAEMKIKVDFGLTDEFSDFCWDHVGIPKLIFGKESVQAIPECILDDMARSLWGY